jgi:hypothetical protein
MPSARLFPRALTLLLLACLPLVARPARAQFVLTPTSPLMEFQLATCVDALGPGLQSQLLGKIDAALRDAQPRAPEVLIAPSVVSVCSGGYRETGAIWGSYNRYDPYRTLRAGYLQGLQTFLQEGDWFAFRFPAAGVKRAVQALWNKKLAGGNRFDFSFNPQADGPIELVRHEVQLVYPDKVVLKVYGNVHLGVPQPFDITFTDVLSTSRGLPACTSAPPVLNAPTISGLIEAARFLLPLPPLPMFLRGITQAQAEKMLSGLLPNLQPGCWVTTMIPGASPLPGRRKLVFSLDAVEVDNNRILARGHETYPVQDRQPRVRVLNAAGNLCASTTDLWDDSGSGRPLTFRWTGPGVFSSPTQRCTNYRKLYGPLVYETVTVTASDFEGLSAGASTAIGPLIVSPPPPRPGTIELP